MGCGGLGDTTRELDNSQVVTFNGKFVCGFRNGDCRTGSQSENTVGSPYGFIIYEIEVLKDNEKVTEVIDVENWCVDNSRLLRWIVSLFKRNSSVLLTKSSIQSAIFTTLASVQKNVAVANGGVTKQDIVGSQSRERNKGKINAECYRARHRQEFDDMQHFERFGQEKLIMEYLVNISKTGAFWSLNEDILKINVLTTNTLYPSRKIRRICACTHQRQRPHAQYAVSSEDQYTVLEIMDDPNITMEEYIRLEEEKAQKRGKVFNWETAKYGKIWYDEDIHDLRSVEIKFPAIAFNDGVSSEKTLSCKPTVSFLNDEIDFRISFDDSDDEDYTVIFNKNSFSYKIISVNNMKTDSENDNEKVNMPLFPSPEPMVNYFDDLDFFKIFENEFLVIVYNDVPTSKSDFLTEPTISIQHIDEFNLKDITSLSEYKDNDDDKVNIEHSSGDLSVKLLPDVINTDVGAYAHGNQYGVSWGMDTAYTVLGPRERNIDEYWWKIYKSGDLDVLES
ncbi:hypothetical protein Tco_1294768 [Tanacetum coccineum]